MGFEKQLPEWNAVGLEPSQNKKNEGWNEREKPPADWFNWFFNTTYLALKELQEKGYTQDEIDQFIQSLTTDLNTKETPTGAQTKANQAEQNAKDYADTKFSQVPTPTWGNIQDKPTAFPPTTHTHPINQVEGLESTLNQKANNTDLTSLQEQVTTHLDESKYKVASGTTTAIELTISSLVDGYAITFIASGDNNETATTINGKPLYKPNTTTTPKLVTGKAYTVWYNQTSDCFFIKASAEGNATSANVLAGKTFSNDDDTGIIGTMPNRGTFNLGFGTNVPAGYYSGGRTKSGGAKSNGSTTSYSYKQAYYVDGNSAGSKSSITVTGLSFEPSIVVIFQPESFNTNVTVYSKNADPLHTGGTVKVGSFNKSQTANAGNVNYRVNQGGIVVNNGSFTLPVQLSSGTAKWFAYE